MKKLLIGSSLLLVLFAACKKSDSSSSNSSKIVGTWTKTYDAVDSNNNGTIDASERVAVPAGDFEITTFNSNGTATDSTKQSGVSLTLAATWTISGDYLTITVTGLGAFSGKLTKLDNNNLIMEDTSAHPASWVIYTK